MWKIYILDPAANEYTMLFVRVTCHKGRWKVIEGLTNR